MRFAVIAVALVLSGTCSPQCNKPSGNATSSSTPSAVAISPSPIPTAPLQAASPPLHNGEVGVAYGAVAFTATGGKSPYSWSVSSGALPSGIALGNDGSVSGTPATAGNFSFTIQVKDAGDSTASIPATIGIAPALSVGLIGPCAQYCNVELGCDTTCGAFGQQNGGAGPFTYSLTGGQLPAGTALNGLSLKGTFGGASGWLQFTVQVGDALGGTASVSPKFWMYTHVAVADGKCYSSFYPSPCSTTLPYSGGVPGAGFSVAVVSASGQMCRPAVTGGWSCSPTTSPPPMFSATIGNGAVNVSVPGQPNNPYEYSGNVILHLSDTDACASGVNCSATSTVAVTFAGG